MGTENILLLEGSDRSALGGCAQSAFRLLERLERLLSKFLSDSDLSRLNEAAGRGPVRVGEELFEVLQRAQEAWELSRGAFDPTVGGLMVAWGMVDMEGRVPSPQERRRFVASGGMGLVRLDRAGGQAEITRAGVSLDLGGIAKGYAADRIVAQLKAQGVASGAVLCGRSTTVTWGGTPSGWRFEVVHPDDPNETLMTVLAVDGAVSSSGAYERYFRRGVRQYGHVLDPASGEPARRLKAATVWTSSGILGDVLSTALFVGGAELLEPLVGEQEANSESAGLRELVARWSAGEAGSPRFAALLTEAEAGSWGGLRTRQVVLGPPPLRVVEGGISE